MNSTYLRLVSFSGLFLLCAPVTACNKSGFTSQSPRNASTSIPTPAPKPAPTAAPTPTPVPVPTATPVPGAPQELSLTCAQLANPTTSLSVQQVGSQATQVQVTGQICPKVAEALTVLFIVDWSGSMAKNDPIPAGGSGCGRSQAAQAILTYLKGQATANVAINVAEIPFSDSVDPSTVIQPTALANFLPQINADTFCQATLDTNYIAAFRTAQQMLAGISGRTVIYFISDGEPNVDASGNSSSQATADSIAAGQQLLTAVPGLTINSLLLGSDGQQAQDLLTQIAGSPDRVKVVADASQLATSILTFPAPALDAGTVKASLVAGAAAAQTVQIASFKADATAPGVWDFETAPLTLVGPAKSTTVDTVTVTVNGSDGSQQQAVVAIKYTTN